MANISQFKGYKYDHKSYEDGFLDGVALLQRENKDLKHELKLSIILLKEQGFTESSYAIRGMIKALNE